MKLRPLLPLLLLCLLLSGCQEAPQRSFSLEEVPDFSGEPYVILNEGQPDFPEEDKTVSSFEEYSPLDYLNRCGPAYANVGPETMPTQEREAIGMVKPTGWQTVKYDCVEGKYLYNRCHLIGYQLTAENANAENLITGTRYLNVTGMLPFENEIADYVKETANHVLYRVTPIFEGTEQVARGVQMEAWSVEDGGEGVCFNVYAYNVQPGVAIDYATGDSRPEEEAPAETAQAPGDDTPADTAYVLNTSSQKFHLPTCSGVSTMSQTNRRDYTGARQALVDQGYAPCGQCKP